MRPTCLYCHRKFATNDVIEVFPYGTRVAWDAGSSRYWLVCRSCGKWNLAPIDADERANLIDFLERWWGGAAARYSAGGVGLAQYSPRLSVVRVGASTWNEFAAWRYGETLRRRRMWRYATWGGGAVVLGALTASGVMAASTAASCVAGGGAGWIFREQPHLNSRRAVCRIPDGQGDRRLMRLRHVRHMELVGGGGVGWALNALHDGGPTRLSGGEAERALALSLPRINHFGGSASGVRRAMEFIRDAGGPGAVAERAVPPASGTHASHGPPVVAGYPAPVRLALEMALHEHRERRALEDELASLRHEWREAEEIATEADTLLPEPRA